MSSPRAVTQGLNLRKDKKAQPVAEDGSPFRSNGSFMMSPPNGRLNSLPGSAQSRNMSLPMSPTGSSPPRRPPNVPRKSVGTMDSEKRASVPLSTRDELLLSLLSSEAVVDSRDFRVLGAEEVEELKKVCPVYIGICSTITRLMESRKKAFYPPE